MLNTQQKVNVAVKFRKKEEVLACPPANMTLWDMHPKVFLAFDQDQQAICPYCSTLYVIADE